ncbi:hypothetical protein H2198_001381 [Neophaeococcomyces mojaviensis]|uniref:Uncharacterized protein n=1 Tax=Neophaeococcomyces mojaviensis TaxID=3383035 RepID=A0ACC3AH89_9EURO|nr:hypothetical protein H2198_001381 [Knufia sp. JES_112]
MASDPITLQVGEQRFTTFRSTLTGESPYFTSFFSDEWHRQQADGSYFVDADGDLFRYILRYLRSGTLPIFYTNSGGHDYSMYHSLLGEAQYFQITRLIDWLKNKEYEKVVRVKFSARELEGADKISYSGASDVQIQHHSAWRTRKIYLCPRRIEVHKGNPMACGRACRNAQGDRDGEFEEEEVLRTLEVSRRTVFDHNACVSENLLAT